MGHKPFDDVLLKVRRGTWRTTTLRLIRAEQGLEHALVQLEQAQDTNSLLNEQIAQMKRPSFNSARQSGQEDVLKLIARWGKCRPLEGYNGEQMAEALRKVITPTIAPYTDYKGIGQAMADGDLAGFERSEHTVVTYKSAPENKGII